MRGERGGRGGGRGEGRGGGGERGGGRGGRREGEGWGGKIHCDVFGSELVSAAIGDALGADRIFRAIGVDGGDAESFAAGFEHAPVVRWLQSKTVGQCLEPDGSRWKTGRPAPSRRNIKHGDRNGLDQPSRINLSVKELFAHRG